MFKKIIGDSSIAFSGRFLTVAFNFLNAILISKMFPASEVGAYFFIMSVVTFFTFIGRMGHEKSSLRFISEARIDGDYEKAWSIFFFSFKIVVYQAIISSPLIAVIIYFSNFEIETGAIISVTLFAIIYTFQFYFYESLRGVGYILQSVFFGGVLWSSLSFISLLLIYFTGDFNVSIINVFNIFSIAGFINVAWLFISIRGKFNQVKLDTDEKIVIKKTAFTIGMSGVAGFPLNNGDIWIVSYFLKPEDVALYGAASRLVFLLGFALQVVNIVVSPHISALMKIGEKEKLQTLLRGSAFPVALIAFLFVVLFFFFGKEMLNLFFGEYYENAWLILMILCIGRFANAITGSCGYVLFMTGQQKFALKAVIYAALITFAAAITVVNKWNVLGVAICFSIGLFILQMSYHWQVKKSSKISTMASLKQLIKMMDFNK